MEKQYFPYELQNDEYKKITNNKKIFLAPTQFLTNKQQDTVDGLNSALDKEIKTYLEQNGYEVVSSDGLMSLWNDNAKLVGGLFDQNTGQISNSRVEDCLNKTITDLRKEQDFSAIVFPKVVLHSQDLQDQSHQGASWFGVIRTVVSDQGYVNRWGSHIAMSLDISIISESLNQVFNGRGGFDFLTKTVNKSGTISRQIKNFNQIPKKYISESIEIAFYPFINTNKVEFTSSTSYIKMVQHKILNHMEYPDNARLDNLEGRVTVHLTISTEGSIEDVEIIRASDHKVFNTAALEYINNAAPFPPPPADLFKSDVKMEIPLIFKPDYE